MGSDKSDDDSVTEINVEVDPSMISEITITATGVSPITAYADTASPADSEPTTLEPQLVVRGLGTPASMAAPPATFAEVGARRGSESDEEEPEEERTTQNLESHLHEVYERAVRGVSSPEASPPRTQLSPIVMTPSKPIRLESSRAALAKSATSAQPRPRAPIPAAGRPPEPAEWEDEESELTARRDPDAPDAKEVADAIRSSAESDAYDEETKTDAVHSELVAFSRAQARTAPLITEAPDVEPDETRTAKAPLTQLSAQAVFMDPPLRAPVVDEGRPKLDAQAAAGGTVRMFFDPATGKASAHPESERNPLVAQRPVQPFGEQPTVQALPLQQNPAVGPPAIVRNAQPAALEETHGARRKPRRVGRFVLLFVVACGASGAGVHYRNQWRPWIMARVPSSWRAPGAAVAPPTPAPDPAASSAAASASAEPSATTSASASVSASASASAQRKNKKGVPPKK